MKTKKSILTSILVFIITAAIAQIPSEGLVAWYPFNGNANDASGNENHGQPMNSVELTTDRFDEVNSAYLFDGIDDFINVPDDNTLSLTGPEFTFSAWVTHGLFNYQDRAILMKSNNPGYANNKYYFWYKQQGQPHGIGVGRFVSTPGEIGFDNSPELNAWVFYSLVKTSNSIEIYIDGDLISSQTNYSALSNTNGIDLRIGGQEQDGGNQWWNGKIDDVRIYNRALSSDEILELYNEENPSLLNFTVTFNVDMTDASAFNPETDDVYIAGDFAYWQQPGTNPNLMLEPTLANPMIYELTLNEIPAGNIHYKYFRVINNEPSWDWGEWSGEPNREVYIGSNVTINDTWGIILPPEEEMVADFESSATSLDLVAVIGSGDWNNYPISQTFMLVDNPDPNGINTSNTVMKFLRRGLDDGGESHAGFIAYETLNVIDYDYLHVMVWKPRVSPLKVTCHDDYNYTYHAFNQNQQKHTHCWEDIVFDLSDFDYETFLFDFMPDYEEPLTANELSEMYFDNFRLSNDSTPFVISISSFMAEETSICANASIAFIPDTANVNVDSVLWSFPGGTPASSIELFPTIEYVQAGNFDVTLTAWHNGLSNVVYKPEYIEVFAVPEAPATPSGSEIVCFSEPFNEYYTNSELAIWELLPANAGSINYYDSTCKIIWKPDFTGEATLKVKIYNGCGEGAFSESLYIQKLESSGVDFSASQTLFVNQPYTVQFTNLTPDQENFDFFWDFGNGETSTEVQPEYTYPAKGEYSITLAATNKTTLCADTLLMENYIFCSGVGIADEENDGFTYYIDQSASLLHLNFTNPPKNAHFSLFDPMGILRKTSILNEKNNAMSLNGLHSGVYIFKIDKKITGKIMLAH
jgi:PKD repeat protein